ncbi:glycosyltransferase [Flavitalea flava]
MKKEKNGYAISVIIPTYNRSELLSYTLDSMLGQNVSRDDFEIIISDDGSRDGTYEVVEKYKSQMNVSYVFQDDRGYRPASARNKGIRMAIGDICLLIDSGVLLGKNCLHEHICFHREKENEAVAIGYIYGFEENDYLAEQLRELIIPADPSRSIERLSGYPVFLDVRESHYGKYNDRIEDLPAPWVYFWTCHVSVPRAQLLNVGLFDENYDGKWGVEDNDLGFRLHQHGLRFNLLRSAQAIHYPHNKNKAERHEEGYQNCLYFHGKFPTLETRIFLEHYKSQELVDVNEISMRLVSRG